MSQLLKVYHEKRDFSKTPEPARGRGTKKGKEPVFVIQHHMARREHYDFRLEYQGVLKSWAVPKGPSIKVGDRRLAVQTEDHPMSYASFEGLIPKGQYGGGEVIVWDNGTYRHLTQKDGKPVSMKKALEMGKVLFELKGVKLKGLFGLYRMHTAEKNAWLLLKVQDQIKYKSQPVLSSPQSVLSGYTAADLKMKRKELLSAAGKTSGKKS
jgi:DNA ligase D-like protein (predicted 3'-phosphoesterase)